MVLAWCVAAIVTGSLSSTASSYSNLASLRDLGINIGLGTYVKQAATDFKGIGPLLIICVAIGFVIAFAAAGLIYRKVQILRPMVFTCAGMAALLIMFLLMEKAFFGTPIIQGSRTAAGLMTQMVCGGIGGLIFALLTRIRGRRA